MPSFTFRFPESEAESKVPAGQAAACMDHTVTCVWWIEEDEVQFTVTGCDDSLLDVAAVLPATAAERASLEASL